MCDECNCHNKTFLVQSVYWQLAIQSYCIVFINWVKLESDLDSSSSVPPVPHGGQIKSLWERSLFTTFPSDHQMTVNGSVEWSDIDVVINLRVSLRQLKVSFGINQSTSLSFRCCALSSEEGTWRPLSAFSRGNIILWHSDWLWWQVTDSWLAVTSGDWQLIGWDARVIDSWLPEVLGWLIAA